ncbi:MAG: alpha/beta hydrolase [Oscillospiraceae bacterium]|nr:alpha/beta hydrolase [Oscillospiraceae bacterium]
MMSNRIALNVSYEKAELHPPKELPTLEPILLQASQENEKKQRPAVIICPGGGYDYCSEREAIPVAMRFAGFGVQAFVLRYSTYRKPFPLALTELAAAVSYVRTHAEEYEVDPQRIAVCGFSAGGHLAASLAVHWNHAFLHKIMGDPAFYRPNAQILCYPVITAGEYTHRGSIVNLVGEQPSAEALAMVALEQQVSMDTPPAFLWHTSNDDCVSVRNSLDYLQALAAHAIPFESHIYPLGCHGLSLSDETTAMGDWHCNSVCEPWFSACIAWIRRGYQ